MALDKMLTTLTKFLQIGSKPDKQVFKISLINSNKDVALNNIEGA